MLVHLVRLPIADDQPLSLTLPGFVEIPRRGVVTFTTVYRVRVHTAPARPPCALGREARREDRFTHINPSAMCHRPRILQSLAPTQTTRVSHD